jgi:hypothetical protein
MQHCGHCGQDVLTTHDLSQCYHCRKSLCPDCEAKCARVSICKQCMTLSLQSKETSIHKLVYQLWLMGFQVVEREVDKLAVRRYTTFQHMRKGLSVMITEALDE